MGKLLKTSFDLESFARVCINHALRLARESLELTVFDSEFYKAVSQEIGIDEDDVIKLHHSFYWFLTNGSCPGYSVLEIVPSKSNHGEPRVRLREGLQISEGSQEAIVGGYLMRFGGYLTERVRRL